MKLNKIIIASLLIVFFIFSIGAISAEDTQELNLTSDANLEIISDSCCDDASEMTSEVSNDITTDAVDDSCCDENTTTNKKWYVEPDPNNPNQVQAPTVQPIIDQANAGDTIILNGTFVHCHFMINKTLTIIATPETSVGVCPHHTHMMRYGTGPESHGIFYISPEASGTVLKGFSFTNDFYYIANDVYNPFGVFIDADNVTLDNLTFNWVGVKNEASKYDPKDFQFDSIILNNSQNTKISNIFLNNIKSFITSVNASNINTEDISIASTKAVASKINVSNINVKVNDAGKLKITLKDDNDKAVANKVVTVIVNGVSKNVTTDDDGVAYLDVKYAAAGTYYATVSFIGDDDYKASVGNAKIVVTKKASSISAPKKTFKVKATKKVAITLKSSGKAVAGKKVTVKVNGKIFAAKTNSKGVATVTVKLTKKGTYKYTAKFAGDKTYKAISKVGKIVVK